MAEGERLLVICNSCRYCEGYCAVFPAMEQRLSFTPADVRYLANLCHNCAECYYACQFAPPHEFAVNVPQVFAEIRAESYKQYAWPAYVRVSGWLAATLGLVVMFLLAGSREALNANFYGIISHETMVAVFSVISGYIAMVYAMGVRRFWKESGERLPGVSAWMQAARDVFTMKNLSSSGAGCTYPDEEHSQSRRVFHHFTFYGFLLCLASTTVAAIYHFAGSVAPHPYFSAPVILGTLGGIGLLIGPVGLYALKRRRDPAIVDAQQDGTDVSFLVLLFLTSLTGLLLLALRESAAMGALLRVHLGVVLGLFLTLPYGKFVHGIYRSAALLRSAYEMARSKH
ncbi:MAG: tricarballylate utilization 4Fe-4S protein TcuB [Bryobacterales bacterium]|nr:tricarballylate utilization 4Fe-4S protein TcuB [Bryobacterales bacterium]